MVKVLRLGIDIEDNANDSRPRGAPVAAVAASRPWTMMDERRGKCSFSRFGAVLEDERKVAGKPTYFTAVVVVM
jgi:hypothetical protein